MRIGALKIHLLHRRAPRKGRHDGGLNLVIEVCDHHGTVRGWGEGALSADGGIVPPAGLQDRLSRLIRHPGFPWHLTASVHIRQFIAALPTDDRDNPLVCAIEMALLDALGHTQHKSLTAFFPIRHGTGMIRYGAVIPLVKGPRLSAMCRRISALGIADIRILVDADVSGNLERLQAVENHFNGSAVLRIDPGGTWTAGVAMAHLPILRHAPIRAVIDPMPPDDAALPVFAASLKPLETVLMLRPSGIRSLQTAQVSPEAPVGLVDVELSRCGGLHRALGIIRLARTLGLRYQISDHQGEAGLLSAAGRALNLMSKDARYRDASPHLLSPGPSMISAPAPLAAGGWAGPLQGAGLGIRTNRRRLDQLRGGAAIVIHGPPVCRPVTSAAGGTAAARIFRLSAGSRPAPEKMPLPPAPHSGSDPGAGSRGIRPPFPG